jgi:hypothetical protein
MTRRATRNKKPIKEIETNKQQTRKRKQSISEDGNNNTVALRKKKAVAPPPTKTNTRKTRVKKTKGLSLFISKILINQFLIYLEVPIREPSPLPIIDRSKHYSTRFSTRKNENNHFLFK